MGCRHRLARILAPVLVVTAALLATTSVFAATLKVACTGTSAMQGLGSSAGHHVPDEMGRDLGAGFEVKNFAVEGTTAISSISTAYANTSQMKAAVAYNPDVVLFWFGGNDSFAGTWSAHKGEFKADYTKLVQTFQALPSHPKTFLVRLWVFVQSPVQQPVIDKEILPIIDQIAAETGSVLIDYRKAFEMHREYFPDGMHPNDTGTLAIGKLFADSVTAALSAAPADAGATSDGSTPDASSGLPDVAVAETAADTSISATGGTTGGSTGGASGSGGNGTGGAPPPSTGSGGSSPPPGASGGSSGCSIAGRSFASPSALLLMGLLGLFAARRRRG
ncbi:MAG: sialate O-acetylesterase [Myxococcales bacterium]|jgi:lysophospholipase L1-like esterase|nr:sialate O-acetylesterase [Myxococcales bacterium]